MSSDPGSRRFPFHIGRWSRPLLLLFGVRAGNSYVDVNDEIDAHFGFYRMHTSISNIARFRIEGPWLWITAIGVRRGIRDGVMSFGGTNRGGIRLDFRERVKWGVLNVPALYVAVDDMEGFAEALRARGIPGEDARRERKTD